MSTTFSMPSPETIGKMTTDELVELEASCFEQYKKARDVFEKMPRGAENYNNYVVAAKEKNKLYDLHQVVQYWLFQSKKAN